MVIDRNGGYVVVEHCNNRYQVFDSQGKHIRFVGKVCDSGNAVGQMNFPVGAAEEPTTGNIFIAEYGNSRIQVFDDQGISLRMIGKQGHEEGHLDHPYDIAFTREGNVVVADCFNSQLVIFTPTGDFVRCFHMLHESMLSVTGVRVSPKTGNFVVTSPQGFQVYSPEGEVLLVTSNNQQWSSFSVGVDVDGNILIPDYQEGRIIVFDGVTGEMKMEFAGPKDREPGQKAQGVDLVYYHPYSVALDQEGNVYFSDYTNATIVKWG